MLGETLSSPRQSTSEAQDGERRSFLKRKSARVDVHIRAILYGGSSFQSTVISDVSTDGAGLDGAAGIAPGDCVMIKLLDGREFTGTVAWWLDGKCGIKFDRRLSEDDPIFQPRKARLMTLNV